MRDLRRAIGGGIMYFYQINAVMKNMKNEDKERLQQILRGNRKSYATVAKIFQDKFFHENGKRMYIFVSEISGSAVTAGAIGINKNELIDRLPVFLNALDLEYAKREREDNLFSLRQALSGDGFTELRTEECTLNSLCNLLEQSRGNGFINDENSIMQLFEIDALSRRRGNFVYMENLILKQKTKHELIQAAEAIFCSETLAPEIERIFKGSNMDLGKLRCGHPVHYSIRSDDPVVSEEIVNILAHALYENGRIKSKRYCSFETFDCSRGWAEILQLYKSSKGGAIVVNYRMHDEEETEFASRDVSVIGRICNIARKHRNDVLTIVVLPRANEKMKNAFMEKMGAATIMEIHEDVVFGEKARSYLRQMAKNCGIRGDKALYASIKDPARGFLANELRREFDRWFDNHLKTKVFSQYSEMDAANKIIQAKEPRGSAYSELDKMIGLSNAKEVIHQALDYYKAQNLFKERGMVRENPAMHMVFTGNPGSAKTSVARLFARIMKENGLLSVGDIVEVGRADLVGKFVGWTAPTVKSKFRDAVGSVLFIDEAYSLVDDRNGCFGDEAINTIVQEMENHREDMVVIFAGYPDKMEGFLQKNPGLRSRIAFHVPFDDYNTDELHEILKLMAHNQKLVLSDDVEEKVRLIFENARANQDFGNGRFSRNLIEKAVLRQASRLVAMGVDTVTTDDISTLIADDFEDLSVGMKDAKRSIGFAV
jgi:hypothetical protein